MNFVVFKPMVRCHTMHNGSWVNNFCVGQWVTAYDPLPAVFLSHNETVYMTSRL